MAFILYNLLLTFLAPIWVPWIVWRSHKRKEQPDWKERCGRFAQVPPKGITPRIWLHAVSVGEVIALRPVLRELRLLLPTHEILLSVTTSSGHQTAREGDPTLFDFLVYFPLDVLRFQVNAMQRVKPDAVVVMETELWMNFLWAAKAFGARTILINGRISDRSFPRSLKVRFYYKALFRNLDRCLVQTATDVERVLAMGASSAEAFGSSKYDQSLESLNSDSDQLRRELKISPDEQVIVIGSTRGPKEEAFVLAALKILNRPSLRIIHAPRHLESAPELELAAQELFPTVGRRSRNETAHYLILDTFGELNRMYGIADVAIVGGGFENLGGQNLVQPLAHGKPVLHGPHMQNFRDVAANADAVGAAIPCSTPEELSRALEELLDNPQRRESMGRAALTLVESNLGASRRYAQAIVRELSTSPT